MVKDFVFTHLNSNSFKLFRDPLYIRNKHSKEGKISDADLRLPADSQYSSITAWVMQVAMQVHGCGLRPGSCLFSSDLTSDMAESCGSIALKGSSCLMGFLYDADMERQTLPFFSPTDNLTHTHTPLLDTHSFCPLCSACECTQTDMHSFQTDT